MSDPLSEIVGLLRPRAAFANVISGKGSWAVRYAEYGLPSFCIVLAGSAQLTVDGHGPITIEAGDFVLLPRTPAFTLSSAAPAPVMHLDPHAVARGRGDVRYGERDGPADMRSLGGAFLFDAEGPGLLVSLLPAAVHIRDSARLSQLVGMVAEETAEERPGREFMMARLVELMLVEGMRASAAGSAPAGLLRGLGDPQLARALREMHGRVAHAWTVDQLASIAAVSRSVFFERFARLVGVAPMEYLLSWRMEIAKSLLRDGERSVAEVAVSVGYGSSSAFSVAFSRRVGRSPRGFARSALHSHLQRPIAIRNDGIEDSIGRSMNP